MRTYGQIQCSFWSDPDFADLSDQAKLLATYLLTGTHSNGLGCYRLPNEYVIADLGWTQDTVSKGYTELYRKGFCTRCSRTNFILIHKYLKWNNVPSGKVAQAREKEFRIVPEKAEIYQQLAREMLKYCDRWRDDFRAYLDTLCDTLSDTPSKGYAIPEQNRTEHEQNRTESKTPMSSSGEPDRVFTYWQDVMNHPKAKLDRKRRQKIRDRLADGYSVDDLMRAVDGCSKSPHHMGHNDRGTVYDDIELICRDAPHVDKFIRLAGEPDLTNLSDSARQTAIAAQRWANEN